MNILITGATGFIGTHLVGALIKRGHHCRCLVRKKSNIEKLSGYNVELFYADITDRRSLQDIARGIDIVFHLAAMGHVSAISEEAYKRFREVNIEGTKNIAEECLKNKIKKFIHFSSTAAMGLIKKPIVDEATPPQPATPYQKSKYESEMAILSFWERYNFPVVILRPCMVYGPGENGKGEFLKICRLIRKGWFPKVGRGRNLTPIVHVDDVVQAALLALEKGIPGQTYLVTSQQSFELDFLRQLIISDLDVNPHYVYVPAGLAKLGARGIEFFAKLFSKTPIVTYKNIDSTITDRVFSIDKAKEELGYCPRMDIKRGISDTLQWYKTQGSI